MSPAERARRADGLREIVTRRDPGDWIDEQLADSRKKEGVDARAAQS
jgi:trehalose 6-phosphate synthase